ncbi:oxidoreductase [Sinomonas gamaensis]|uniref:oxidoreductase n=1 Tax=Sinomonas gamaensis TaxID=2565624 RepID=UPI001BB202EA|nr:oxidoreductase [Sinomonas gamaensis]
MSNTEEFRAFVAVHGDEATSREVRDDLGMESLGDGDVLIRVSWSSVNYKDGLASTFNGKVARQKTHVPGIDLAGTVVQAPDDAPACEVGAEVIVHGYDLGVAHHGGFSEYARVPSHWIVPLPHGLSAREAMAIGTAGFTAALSVQTLEDRGLRPGDGPVLVTGASGGVGSIAVDILAGLGYEVVASTGKADGADWLKELGASGVISREETSDASRPLNRERWAGAVDCVGGSTLSYVLSSLRYGASVAASGNTGGASLNTTVFPFILRGASLLGIDSVQCPIEVRRALWQRLATDMRPRHLEVLATGEVTLDELPTALDAVLAGRLKGRTVVRVR